MAGQAQRMIFIKKGSSDLSRYIVHSVDIDYRQ